MTALQGSTKRGERRFGFAIGGLGFALFCAVFAALPQIGPVIRINNIPATSMAPNYMAGAYAVVNIARYGYSRQSFDWVELPVSGRIPNLSPARGDVMTFRVPAGGGFALYIKRVVGLPGDRVQMAGGRLLINGVAAERVAMAPFTFRSFGEMRTFTQWREKLPNGVEYPIVEADKDEGAFDNTQEFLVPPGHLFVLGDNRDNSSDSRMAPKNGGIGFVPTANVVGKVVGHFGG